MNAAREHSAWMLETNYFSHTGEGGSSPAERIQASGYGAPELSAENLSVIGGTQLDSTQAIDDHHTQLILSPGHRVNIFRNNARELGPGQATGDFEFDGQTLPASMMTQKYATRGSGYFITGVIYRDINSDNLYDVGEGIANVVITLNGTAYPVHASGVYSIPVANNSTYQLTIAGGDLPAPREEEVQIMSRNVKLDVIITGETVNTVSW